MVIIILVFVISFANIFASETKAENFGDQSLLFSLASGTTLGAQYVEEGIDSGESTVKSYWQNEQTALSPETNGLAVEETELNLSSDSAALIKPEIPSLEAARPTRTNIIDYTVKPGDTIGTIAQMFGISQNTILWENNLTSSSYIRPNDVLRILPTTGISYKVAKNDTMGKIAQKYSADKNKILDFNRLVDESDIQIGQLLIIPEGKPYYAPAPAQPKLATIQKIFVPVSSHIDVPSGDKMAWPTTARRISQYFNWRHVGLDIDGDFGDPIWTAADGVVTKSLCQKTGYGCHVIVDHGNGLTTLYAHFQKLYVKEGQKVVRGDVLGEQGSTGKSTGAHLHFEVRINGKKYNPLSYIK